MVATALGGVEKSLVLGQEETSGSDKKRTESDDMVVVLLNVEEEAT